jgi:hypothetical protein
MTDKEVQILEPAFPSGNPEVGGYSGMTLRDYFAGQALLGLIKNSGVGSWYALQAYEIADAMIKEREK